MLSEIFLLRLEAVLRSKQRRSPWNPRFVPIALKSEQPLPKFA